MKNKPPLTEAEREVYRGNRHAIALAQHLAAMGAANMEKDVIVGSAKYRVNVCVVEKFDKS